MLKSVKTESNPVKMKEEVKPSSNEWVTFIFYYSYFLHLRSLLQAREIRKRPNGAAKSATETRGKKTKHHSNCAAQVDDGKVSRVSRRV
jgi:hypothetical protein